MVKICLSGGAEGADTVWGDEARKRAYAVHHFSFEGHKTSASPQERLILTQDQLRLANARLARAAKSIRRSWPPKHDYTRKLLQRNGFQVPANTQGVYAVGELDERTDILMGGTSWAVQMFIDQSLPGRPLSVYVYDQAKHHWLRWMGEQADRGSYAIIAEPPPPPDIFTGIGSRKLNSYGERAIRCAW